MISWLPSDSSLSRMRWSLSGKLTCAPVVRSIESGEFRLALDGNALGALVVAIALRLVTATAAELVTTGAV
jgi:hypothetical protein